MISSDDKSQLCCSSHFYETAALPGMMKHSLDISLSTTIFLNEGQIIVLCGDQTLHAICKGIQWLYLPKYGLDKVFLIMGGLCIEKETELVLGRYFERSGVTDHLVLSSMIPNSGKAFFSGSFIIRS